MTTNKPEQMLWADSARGIYIPQYFATSFADRAKHVANVDSDEWAILEAGPDHADYWDAWADVYTNAIVTDESGNEFSLYQDGDLWLVPVGMEWSEESDSFEWPEEAEAE